MKNVLENYLSAKKPFEAAFKKLEKETERVMKAIYKACSVPSSCYWYFFDDWNEDDESCRFPEISGGWVSVSSSEIIDTGITEYTYGFPVKFFSMTDKQIKDHIWDEIAKEKRCEDENKAVENRIGMTCKDAMKKFSKKERTAFSKMGVKDLKKLFQCKG